jgi:UDP-N-acetylmuramate: L-alanyl-gamma-D-glutamyl-meso-diaminopimelate ligase
MKMGVHKDRLSESWQQTDHIFLYLPDVGWNIPAEDKLTISQSIENIINQVIDICRPNDHIVLMSNGGFAGIRQKLTDALKLKFSL